MLQRFPGCAGTYREGAAAAPLAALLREQKIIRNKRVALIHSGCNIDRDLFASVLANPPSSTANWMLERILQNWSTIKL
jgi:threonine dehydratase